MTDKNWSLTDGASFLIMEERSDLRLRSLTTGISPKQDSRRCCANSQ